MLLIMIFNWDIKSLHIVYVKRSQAIKVVKFKLANYLNLMLLFICLTSNRCYLSEIDEIWYSRIRNHLCQLRFTRWCAITREITSVVRRYRSSRIFSILCDGRPLYLRRERIGILSFRTREIVCCLSCACICACTTETSGMFSIQVISRDITTVFVDSAVLHSRMEIIELAFFLYLGFRSDNINSRKL